jgi:hypothetical protein
MGNKVVSLLGKNSALICAFCGLFLVSFLGGCAGMVPDGDMQQYTLIVTKRTDFYKNSPDQPSPPDMRLDEGTRLRVLSSSGEYVKIETVFGKVGWISSSDVGPMPVNTYQPTGG